ncbi:MULTISPECIES: NAD(P)H-quinone oxidoreductase [Mycobacteroides]|jgi:putative PIG3 family NAD(P)H quinone oxidoreductase|uniref:NAD(P)H-quinone oxidoreductase n=1 Tax=Mycobacteroides TaxID=670516 RepID=UPI000714F1BE|nr:MULTISPECIES: NAD(P)H-quinone oxidoreductase [Mycobacteroides]AMW17991.1 quinone oxidoreductase [Mycobacterium sp. QIA-37]AYM40320.1 NAD(P)H-quinone oxidoreductase [[Mycobacterium] chelonae subsp. gwanakae]KRQ29967.1 quinone oxidoreductase [Mycobacteroides sp. H072]KRQ38902.1 quinone oxidoreductase [Mycobacteroides sp. H002]KRQ49226.1 quinone oxidoreductase [Mycobacteroides sp. H054]
MHAITVDQPGGPEALCWTEVPDPTPGPGEILIDVTAAAVNRADLLQRQGLYPMPPGASHILGLECSGVIAQVGADVSEWAVGQAVCALLSGGGYAEKVVVPAGQVLPIPSNINLDVAAALPEVACTVWSNLVMTARMAAGQSILIHGGSSGIGTHAIQVAKALGVRVAITAGTPDKLDACRDLGADLAINYRATDFVQAVHNFTDGAGVDLILDIMGAKYLDRNVDALGNDGHLVIIGMQGGAVAELNIAKLITKRGSITATTLRGRPLDGPSGKAAIVDAVTQDLWPLVEAGKVLPIVGAEIPVSQAGEAHRLLESGEIVGKVLLTL